MVGTVSLDNVQTRINDFVSDPVMVGYEVFFEFGTDSGFIPTQLELDNLIWQAFSQTPVQGLLMSMQGLPPSNPFVNTSGVSYVSEDGTVFR